MLETNYLAVVVAAVAAFLVGAIWYSPLLFGNAYLKLRGLEAEVMADVKMLAGTIVVELVRTLVVSYVFARFVALVGAGGWMDTLLLGGWAWLGFPAMILLGSVIHENVPGKLAAIHAGDWLVKLLLMAVILSLWR